jgi:ribosome-associated heat shock protein Hsp15
MEQQRVDKWLWCARFFKTRSLAADAVKTGRVQVNGQRAKPARNVEVGEVVSIRQPPYSYEVTVDGLSNRRGPAAAAQTLYTELPESRRRREILATERSATAVVEHKPYDRLTKKERRMRERLKRGEMD